MPIFSYFAVVGSVLMALLFVADANLPKQGPIAIGSQVVELPGAQRPRTSMGSTLVSEPAPAPDMNSEAVRAAAPPATQIAQAQANAPQAAQQIAKAEIVPVKKKRVVRRPAAPQDEDARHYAFRNNYDGGPFGGGPMFGRF